MFYKIVSCGESEESLIVSKDFAEKYINSNIENMNVCAGQRKIAVKVKISSNLKSDMMKASKKVLDNLLIPLGLFYQLNVQDDCIRIGPIIGILINKRSRDLTKGKLKRLLAYTLLYKNVNGVICVFSWEGIDFKSKLLKGYYYNYDGIIKKGYWKEGTLPLPDVIYNRTLMRRDEIQKLKELVNNKLFNSFHINKLDFWNMAKQSILTAGNIPETRPLTAIKDVDKLLDKYDYVYLKPVDRSLATGLIRVHKSKGNYCFQVNDNPHPVIVQNGEAAINYFNRIKHGQKYLVQQGINSIKFQDRYIDFRVIMQKDKPLKWNCIKIVAKIGKQDGICSNFMDSGYALSFEEVFKKLVKLENSEVNDLKNKLIEVCHNVCEVLDETGENFADIGIDAAIDDKLNIWILEVNTRHDHKIVLSIKDEEVFHEIKGNPIRYAVAISSFDICEDS